MTSSATSENLTMTETSPIITINKLNKWYGKFHVLKDIDLDINKTEKIVICGPSGSGKSTLIRCINRLEVHQEGSIVVDGTELTDDVKQINEIRSDVGMVFQHFNLFPHLTVLENCTLAPIWVRKKSKIEADELGMELLNKVRIPDQAHKYPGQLSGGQQQRVAVARSLVFDPQLVLMDEPLGALDKNLRESMQYELKHIHESLGVTVVYVTHDQSEALTMSNRIAVFNDGYIQQLSNPNDLYETPVNSFVAEFIGENNTITGTVKEISGGQAKVEIDTGETVIANPIAVSSVGEKTKMSLRPERVSINPDNSENKFEALVKEIIYHGDHTRVRVNILNDDQFILKIPNSSNEIKLNVDDKVQLGWTGHDCRALDF